MPAMADFLIYYVSGEGETGGAPIDTFSTTPAITGLVQPIGNKVYSTGSCRTDSDWSHSLEDKLENG
jgi:hypothetical protein